MIHRYTCYIEAYLTQSRSVCYRYHTPLNLNRLKQTAQVGFKSRYWLHLHFYRSQTKFWGKAIFLHLSVILFTGGWRGVPDPRGWSGGWSGGVWSGEVCVVCGGTWSRGVWSRRGAWSWGCGLGGRGVPDLGGAWSREDAWSQGVWSGGGSGPGGWVPGPGGEGEGSGPGDARWRPPGMATAAGSTHPTGMHSYCLFTFWFSAEKSQNLKGPIGRNIDLTLYISFFNKYGHNTFEIRIKNKMQCGKYFQCHISHNSSFLQCIISI